MNGMGQVSIPAAGQNDSKDDDTEVDMVIFMKGVTLLLSYDIDQVSSHVLEDTKQVCGPEAQTKAHQ